MNSTLQVPVSLYGTVKEVRLGLTKRVKMFASGKPWSEAIADEPMMSATESAGLIILNGPAQLLAHEPNIHAFMPLSLVFDGVRNGTVSDEKKDEAVAESLLTAWGLLGVLSSVNQLVVYPPSRHQMILDATISLWDALDSVGPRYSVGLREGSRLWDVPTNLKYVLSRLGVPDVTLRAPLPAGALRAVLGEVSHVRRFQ